MCGIAGLVRFDGLRREERNAGVAMASRLRHRGPDDLGGHHDAWASLGHARLSIIDPDGGHQPMSNEDGTVQVVFNGEIFNHAELAATLRARGHVLKSRCDTEVIAHLYEECGDQFVQKLNGMFAIALWDARQHRLLLVRDRMGIKPLYWHAEGDRVAFGSELKAVLEAGEIGGNLDAEALKDYLTFGHVPAPKTILEGVRKLEPGHMLLCSQRRIQARRYWDIPFEPADSAAESPSVGRSEQEWTDAFSSLFEECVAMRLEADVPLGAFLSGGVDSAAVVAAMARRCSGPVRTYTIGFEEEGYDERDQARRVAAMLNTDHHESVVRADAVETARRLVSHFDEPFADPCAIPAFHLAQAARRHVTVSLSGDGPDEMLAGYRRYRFDLGESATRALAPAWLRRRAFGLAGRMYPKADWLPRHWRAKRTLQNLAADDITAHLCSVAICAGELPGLLLAPDLNISLAGYDPFTRGRDLFASCPSPDLLNRLLYVDMKTLLADEILTKVDRTSMAVGLEVRVPFLDYRLVELSARLPVALKLRDGCGKRVLRETVRRWLGPGSAEVAKHGFDVPTDTWFRGPLRTMVCDELLSGSAAIRRWLEPRAVERIAGSHLKGAGNHGQTLWTLFVLEQWARSFAASRTASVAPSLERREVLTAV